MQGIDAPRVGLEAFAQLQLQAGEEAPMFRVRLDALGALRRRVVGAGPRRQRQRSGQQAAEQQLEVHIAAHLRRTAGAGRAAAGGQRRMQGRKAGEHGELAAAGRGRVWQNAGPIGYRPRAPS
ncbi:hypothetical protein I0E98_01910 [Pseudomonas lalucatii]|nr:hypothetical protein [Pseudomonas lalucatii]